MMHALDYFIRGEKEKLLKKDFGMGSVSRSFTYKQWKFEANILAMTTAALSLNYKWPAIKSHTKKDMDVVLGNCSDDQEMPDRSAIDTVENDLLEYWFDNYSILSSKYKEMTDWIHTQQEIINERRNN